MDWILKLYSIFNIKYNFKNNYEYKKYLVGFLNLKFFLTYHFPEIVNGPSLIKFTCISLNPSSIVYSKFLKLYINFS